ncbi:MAG: excinuclease ABC subunit UvrA [Verrucomicrobiota bacterium]|nr:excinuclease ABC subunit UvrA [Verrucomicrobiota bacterium]
MPTNSPNIIVIGARHNNLKNVNLEISPGELTVITGLSGSGKSTLLFDVLHAEGQRRYVETFSPYVRQFLDNLPRPQVQSIENARPSIAVEQKNSVKNSRSTVGTMTELCDYFKVWFSEVATLYDPQSGDEIKSETIETQVDAILSKFTAQTLLFGFQCKKPKDLGLSDFISFLIKAGHTRVLTRGKYQKLSRLDEIKKDLDGYFVVVDKIEIKKKNRSRLLEAVKISLEKGKGYGEVRSEKGELIKSLLLGLQSKVNGKIFEAAHPNSFSFNSPQGACPECRGFGRNISINEQKVIPDTNLTISQNAIRAFSGKVFSHCQDDLLSYCQKGELDAHKPINQFSSQEIDFLWNGDPDYEEGTSKWYGINNFFRWVEKKTYKMHIRVFLSKYRGYFECPKCKGGRLKEESTFWKWKQKTLPEIYALPVDKLKSILPVEIKGKNKKTLLTLEAIHNRLRYLQEVGLGYLTLDRSTKTLSGGETQRVNLTTCLGSALTDAMFALDEPTIGLHGKDVSNLIKILRKLADSGNCVCVVEHDEQVIKAADKVIEIGPEPGTNGGRVVFSGKVDQLIKSQHSLTGKWLSNDSFSKQNKKRNSKKVSSGRYIKISNASLFNLNKFSAKIPLGQFVCVAGVSGSGKSTLVNHIIYEGLSDRAKAFPGQVTTDMEFEEAILVDQTTVSKTPRSNPILYTDGWSPIKEALGRTDESKMLGYLPPDFSFNSGNGRCEECGGLGYEIVEMQFLSNLQIPCSFCNGMRFKDDVLKVKLNGLSVLEILNLCVSDALKYFADLPKTHRKLKLLDDVGLGYLTLGQPLNTLSGGESQRLKLVKYLGSISRGKLPSILLIDEPTTGLHMQDVCLLIKTLKRIVEAGHSVIVIEHNAQVLRDADWILEMGPGAGENGGKITASGKPSSFLRKRTLTSDYLFKKELPENVRKKQIKKVWKTRLNNDLQIIGARENNLRDISVKIPHGKFVVVTGPSGSGKSSLAFDVVFAEGQRRFMESMSAYARQFVEQMGKPNVDHIKGMRPTVAIEQRVTRGSRKSTVGSITEIAQYLRLLYAKLGIQISKVTGKPLQKSSAAQIESRVIKLTKRFFRKSSHSSLRLLSPLVTNRKGHHKPIVNWAREKGFEIVRCDGQYLNVEGFEGLDRYRLHDIEVEIGSWVKMPSIAHLKSSIDLALKIGKGRCVLIESQENETWFSTTRIDPANGTAYPELEPSFFSWNSAKGMCTYCKGYGKIYDWMKEDLPASGDWWKIQDGTTCPKCEGQRLNSVARHVFLETTKDIRLTLPQLLSLPPTEVIDFLNSLKISSLEKPIGETIIPEISERLSFMKKVGLEYLSLDRETSSLSGGEAQRIRLASQLGSNLSGVLYVLDEPSIGLHPIDNQRLLDALRKLMSRGNSLLVVEHDAETIEQADFIIDVGPEAGFKGGKIISCGKNILGINERASPYFPTKSLGYQGRRIALPKGIRDRNDPCWIRIDNVNFRNIKNESFQLPKERLTVCCGVSGAGKSSLVRGVIFSGIQKAIDAKEKTFSTNECSLKHGNDFGKAIEVDQKPIGKTSRSTPATYLGVWDRIRGLFCQIQEAKALGLTSSAFSFNVKGGRCETCKGNGKIKLEMNFLPDSYVTCSSCNGKRFKEEILSLKWNGKNVAEVLDLTFEEAHEFFDFDFVLCEIFGLMIETGLGYLKLGQVSPTLSGGEAQRLKLASELIKGIDKGKLKGKPKPKANFYVLEEPTIGLHQKDRKKLLKLLRKLVKEGNTVLVVEHDVDLISNADYVIEIGPKGGKSGGQKIFQGTVENLIKSKRSITAKFVKKAINS